MKHKERKEDNRVLWLEMKSSRNKKGSEIKRSDFYERKQGSLDYNYEMVSISLAIDEDQ